MIVADEGVAAVRGVWLFGWYGRFETCPYGLAGRLHRWRGLGVVVVEGRGVWLVCPSPPRAYPARGASLARAPFAVRKGRGWCWFSGSAGKRCVGGLVGSAGLEPALTGWLTRCLVGCLGVDHSWSVVRRARISVVGVSSSSSAGWRAFYSFWGQDPHFELTLSFIRWCGEG